MLTTGEMPSHNHQIQQAGSDGDIHMQMGKDGTYPNESYLSFGTSVKPFVESTILIAYTGGNAAHNNMQPSLAVARWKRVA